MKMDDLGLPLLLEIPISPFQTNLVELWLLVKQRFQDIPSLYIFDGALQHQFNC